MENLTPLKNYTPPQFPTLEAAQSTPELLKRMPHRWQKFSRKAAAVACVGIMSFTAFAMFPLYASASGNSTFTFSVAQEQLETLELQLSTHHGGAGSGPFYVVRFTEQEAFGFIHAKLEAAGLDFSATPPDYSVSVPNQSLHFFETDVDVGLIYFDEARRVGLANGANVSAQRVVEAFAEKGLTVGVFTNPSETVFDGMTARSDLQRSVWKEHGDQSIDMWDWIFENLDHPLLAEEALNEIRDAAVAEAKEPARRALIKSLTSQTQSFIDQLQAEGILPPHENGTPQEITVTLNGTPLVFDVAPIIIDGRTLVPMRAIYEALNFEVEWIEETQTINAVKNDSSIRIEMQIGNSQMRIRNVPSPSDIELDVPPRIINGRTLVPLRAISTAIGANVDWEEATRTVTITQGDSQQRGYANNILLSTHSITRILGGNYQAQLPQVFLTYDDFNQYLDENWALSGRLGDAVAGIYPSFMWGRPVTNYAELWRRSEDFFNDYFIVTLVIVEGSGPLSHRYRLDNVDKNGNINMTRPLLNGMAGTMEMAQLYVEIVLSKEHVPAQFRLNMTDSQE